MHLLSRLPSGAPFDTLARIVLGGILALLTTGAALAAPSTPDGWIRLPGRGVQVHAPSGAADFAETVALRAPGLLARVDRELGLPSPDETVHIVLAPSERDLERAVESGALPRAPGWAAGYVPRGSNLVAITPHAHRGPLVRGFWSVLHHELVHVRMGRALGRRGDEVPAWFWEGTASVLAREGALRDVVTLARTALQSGAPTLEELEAGFPARRAPAEAAYVASYAFVSWLVDREGTESLGHVIRRTAGGESFEEAFRATYGDPPADLEASWRWGFLWRYRWIPLLTSGTTLWFLVTGLVVVAWWRKRRQSRAKMEAWEEEERRRRELTGWVH